MTTLADIEESITEAPGWDDWYPSGLEQTARETGRRRTGSYWLFLLLALPTTALTLVLLPYAWGRALVVGMMRPQGPEWWVVALLAGGIAGCMVLSRAMARRAPRRRALLFIMAAVVFVWTIGNGVLISMFLTESSPRLLVVPLYALASLWVLWLAWLPAWPLPWFLRFGLLVVLLMETVGFLEVCEVRSLTGDARLEFALRFNRQRLPGDQDAEDEFAEAADLTATTKFDYPQFLGPWRMAIAGEMVLARDWEANPPREIWRRNLGAGWGGFAVVGDFAVTQEQCGNYECVSCYRIADGTLAWRHRDLARFVSPLKAGDGPRATPTVSDGRVYSVGATGILNCLDGTNGKVVWTVDILEGNGSQNIQHGVAGSPLVYDDFVVVSPTGKNGPALVAYDRETGERRWQAGSDQASYSSPMIAEIQEVKQVLLFTSKSIAGHDAVTGKELWSFPWENSEHINASQPIPNAGSGGQVFISTGYGKGAALLQVSRGNDGAWSVDSLWQRNTMKTKFTTPVTLWGYVYGLDDGVLECIDLKDGKRVWKDGRFGHGQLLICWGKGQNDPLRELLVVQAEDGSVHLVRATHAGLRELGSVPGLASKTWNTPALAGRFLLIRNDREAVCYEVPLEEP